MKMKGSGVKFSFVALLSFVFVIFSGCAQNHAWRTNGPAVCPPQSMDHKTINDKSTVMLPACKTTYIERHEGFDLAFFEFSERGNIFDDGGRVARTLDYIKKKSDESEHGIALAIFVHGWKYNADPYGGNVISFRKQLNKFKQSGVAGHREVVGVYIGWRGLSFYGLTPDLDVLENFTFWERKAVAQEVGKGGVTELLLRLNEIDRAKESNLMLVTGHSFGGAIVLSALNELLLEDLLLQQELVTTDQKSRKGVQKGHVFKHRIGDSVVLLNPAIEANQMLQLKEASMRLGYQDDVLRRRVLHVLSSEGDYPTRLVFPVGQFFDLGLTWNQEDLSRSYYPYVDDGNGKFVKGAIPFDYELKELCLDTQTVGNYTKFLTGSLCRNDDPDCFPDGAEANKNLNPGDEVGGIWVYNSFCGVTGLDKTYLPCSDNDPVSVMSVSESFIEDHGDVFNDNVSAYLFSLVEETLFKSGENNQGKSFNFPEAFNRNLGKLRR